MLRRLFLCFCFLPLLSAGSVDPCSDPTLAQAWEASPVHREALQLAQRLEARGFKVECMARSKEEQLFEGQKGAAWIKTDRGIFEAWFLPSSQTFENLKIKQTVTREGRYLYSFSGLAHVPPTMDSSRPIAFIKDGSVLYQVWNDQALAAELRRSLPTAR